MIMYLATHHILSPVSTALYRRPVQSRHLSEHTNQLGTERSAAQVEINTHAHIAATCTMAVQRVVRRLRARFPAETVRVAILSAYQTLGPTEDQERAVTEFKYLRQLSNCGTIRELCCAGAGGGGQL